MARIGSGILALRQGRSEVAVTQLAHGVKVDPSDVNFLLLAQALFRAGRPAEADSASAQAQKISPDLSEAQNTAGPFLSFARLKPLERRRPEEFPPPRRRVRRAKNVVNARLQGT